VDAWREEAEEKKVDGEEVLDRCDLGDMREIEFMRRILRASREDDGEEILDRCTCGHSQEIEFMRRVLRIYGSCED